MEVKTEKLNINPQTPSAIKMVNEGTLTFKSSPQANPNRMINGGTLAIIVMVGSFFGMFLFAVPLIVVLHAVGILITLGVCTVSLILLNRQNKISVMSYIYTLLSSILFPFFGGLSAFVILTRKRLVIG